MKKLIGLIVVALCLLPSTALASENPHRVLRDIAAQTTHGHQDVGKSWEAIEAKYEAGKRVYLTCGWVSVIGARAMARLGVPFRRVGAFSTKPGGKDFPRKHADSHQMLEVWRGGKWVLYDLDGNGMAVNKWGKPVGLRDWAKGRHHRYRPLANDRPFRLKGSSFPRFERWLFRNHEKWLDRVLTVLTIEPHGDGSNPGFYYWRDSGHARLWRYSDFYWQISADEWNALYEQTP